MGYRIRIKVCGVTTPEDAWHAGVLGADAVGLNFYPKSPRFLDPANCVPVIKSLPPFVEPVALFVEQPLSGCFAMLNRLGAVRSFQLHGTHRELSDTYPFRFVPAFPVADRAGLDAVTRYLDATRNAGRLPAAVLIDGHVAGKHGGTGVTAPWPLLADFRSPVPFILAGGLTPDNVAEAIRIVRPYGVDVAGGVESGPGRKDSDKMRRFIDRAREAADKLPTP